MTDMKFELLMKNLKVVNLAQAAKDDYKRLFEEVKKKSIDGVLSRDPNVKDAVIMANMTLIGKLIRDHISLIDDTQKANMNISGVERKRTR